MGYETGMHNLDEQGFIAQEPLSQWREVSKAPAASPERLDMRNIRNLQARLNQVLLAHRGVDQQDEAAYFESISRMNHAFEELTNAFLYTIEASPPENLDAGIFRDLQNTLKLAGEHRGEIYGVSRVHDKVLEQGEKIAQLIPTGNLNGLSLLCHIVETGREEQKEKAYALLENNFDVFSEHLRTQDTYIILSARYLKILLDHNSEKATSQVKSLLNNLIANKKSLYNGAFILGALYHQRSLEGRRIVQDILATQIQKYGLDVPKVMEQWTRHWKGADLVIYQNLETLIRLESEVPGAARFLNQGYGITHFGRYPVEMLVEQYKNSTNTELPYGVVMFPEDDHSGAFQQKRSVLQDMHKGLKDEKGEPQYLVRIFECASRKELGQDLVALEQLYGKSHKIAFALLGGHGTPNSIRLGDGRGGVQLFSSNFRKGEIQQFTQYFEPDANIILASCFTGVKRGVGQTLSEQLNLKVIAPDRSTKVRSIKPRIRRNKIDFTVKYTDDGTEQVYLPRAA